MDSWLWENGDRILREDGGLLLLESPDEERLVSLADHSGPQSSVQTLPDDATDFVVEVPRQTSGQNTIWTDPGVEIKIDTEVSFDNGNTWMYAGGFGAFGGTHIRRGGAEATSSSMRVPVPPGSNRQVRVTFTPVGTARTACDFRVIKPVLVPKTGLGFQSNHQVADDNSASVRFRFTGSALVPIYGTNGAGVTYLLKYRPRHQVGYFTVFFWANDDGLGTVADTFEWDSVGANTYYGAHPYPHDGVTPLGSSGTEHRWEISTESDDFVDVNDPVAYDVWHSQALRVRGGVGQNKVHQFNWSLPVDPTKQIIRTSSSSTWGDNQPPFPALTFGDAPWQPGRECASGTLRGLQIYNALLTDQQVDILGACETDAEVLAAVAANSIPGLFYLNMNPTPDDISDKSGQGHHPQWFNSNRPVLWTE